RPSRYIETMVTRTTETVIDRLRRMPVQISWRRKRGLMVLGQPRVGVEEVKLWAGRSGVGRDDPGVDEGSQALRDIGAVLVVAHDLALVELDHPAPEVVDDAV